MTNPPEHVDGWYLDRPSATSMSAWYRTQRGVRSARVVGRTATGPWAVAYTGRALYRWHTDLAAELATAETRAEADRPRDT